MRSLSELSLRRKMSVEKSDDKHGNDHRLRRIYWKSNKGVNFNSNMSFTLALGLFLRTIPIRHLSFQDFLYSPSICRRFLLSTLNELYTNSMGQHYRYQGSPLLAKALRSYDEVSTPVDNSPVQGILLERRILRPISLVQVRRNVNKFQWQNFLRLRRNFIGC